LDSARRDLAHHRRRDPGAGLGAGLRSSGGCGDGQDRPRLDPAVRRENPARAEERQMYGAFQDHLAAELAGIDEAGLTKRERGIRGPQRAEIVADGAEVLNFCANNYLGLADDPRILEAAKEALDEWGYGLASVRFICGTQDQHLELERRLAGFLGTDD
ncbi:hypothetical protein ABE10_01140, partial [Bacillus toyonensis]|nr:hypothetical protein [Bacillus toyonensis]